MASLVRHGEMPDRFRYHLAEAIDALGYYRSDALEQLLGMYRAKWPKGLSSTLFRIADIQPLLTGKGLADPARAQKATYLRSHFNLSREEFDQQDIDGVTGLMFWAPKNCVCSQAGERDQSKIGLAEKWPLPLAGCDWEWCACNWTWSFGLD